VPGSALPAVRHRLVNLLAASVLGGVPLLAAGCTPVIASSSVEAETFALPAAEGQLFSDPAASGGSALLIWTTGTATAATTIPAASTITVRARGDQCAGAPLLRLAVDGAVAGTTAVSSSTWTDVVFTGSWTAGLHQLAVSYTNDAYLPGCDRNLRVDKISFSVASVPTIAKPVTRLFGLSSSGDDRGIPAATATAASLGRHLDVVNFYEAWVWNAPLPVTQLNQIAAAGGRPEITWEPWDPRQGATQPSYSLSTISSGSYDSYISGWARAAAAYGKPLMLRFAHEMNGNWYPWSPAVNGGSGAGYVAAYRHVHDLFRAAGATNVSWVWSPNVVQGMPTDLAQAYPGPGYVDTIGVDGYNGGTDVPSMGGWRSPQQVFAPTLQALAQLAPGVPVILNETGSSENGGDKATWITQLFSYLSGTPVTGVVWFDFANAGQADWRLATSPASLAAARAALAGW